MTRTFRALLIACALVIAALGTAGAQGELVEETTQLFLANSGTDCGAGDAPFLTTEERTTASTAATSAVACPSARCSTARRARCRMVARSPPGPTPGACRSSPTRLGTPRASSSCAAAVSRASRSPASVRPQRPRLARVARVHAAQRRIVGIGPRPSSPRRSSPTTPRAEDLRQPPADPRSTAGFGSVMRR
jgi:hypothetical protein